LEKLVHSVRQTSSEEWSYLRENIAYMLNRRRFKRKARARKEMTMLSFHGQSLPDGCPRSKLQFECPALRYSWPSTHGTKILQDIDANEATF
jgi:hypothetical protein